MNRRHLLELIEEGENIQCEFKRHFTTPEKIAREMIAFANTKGGYMIFGVDDDKEVVGVDSEKSESEMIKDAAENFCEPPLNYSIDFIELYGKEVVVASIPESDNKPHRLQDYENEFDINKAVVLVRVNDKSVTASKEMVRILRANSANLALKKYQIGQTEKMVFEYLAKYERISVKELSNLVNISERRASRTLVKMVRANLLMIHTKDNGEEFFTASA
ncbi:MAG: putative DNA binding domain-containing protein [Ignavibacteriaceae bacterium]|nr:putative DNA binding domain-containing protein [Ignavibacteriaceae bacterium]